MHFNSKIMTEYEIHRLKWGNYAPSPIKALAYNKDTNYLAIGRENGEIEVSYQSYYIVPL